MPRTSRPAVAGGGRCSATRWSLRAAWTYVKRRRPMVSPLLIYFEQLRTLEAAEHRLTEPTITKCGHTFNTNT